MNRIESLESLLAVAITLPEKIDALNALAWELRFDDVLRAKTISESAYELAVSVQNTEHPYPKGLAESLRNLGHCHERLANYEVEISLLTEALSLFEQIGDCSGQATVLYLLGSAYWCLGDYYHALERSLKSIELSQEINDRFSLAKAWNIVGLVYQSIGDLTEALECFLKSLQIYEEIGNKRGQSDTLSNSCEIAFGLKEYDKALTFGLRSLQLHEELNYKDDFGIILTAVGRVYLALGQPQQALYCLHRGLNASREGVNRYSELRCLLYLGEVYNQQGDRNLALSFLQQALPLAQEIETKQELYECYRILADIYKQEADFEKALAAYEQFHTLKEDVLNEIAKQKLDILVLVQQLETTQRETEIQLQKNVELEREIVARKQAEEALQASEDHLRHIFAALSDHIYVTEYTFEGQRINRYLSPIEALTGYPLEKLMADWSFWPSTIIHPDDQAKAASQAHRFAQGQSGEMEYRLIRADGRVIWVRDSGRVEQDPHSGSLFVYGVVSDITARKQAEEALRQSEAKNRAILNAIPDWMLRLDSESRFIDFSAYDGAEWYVQPEIFMGKTVSEILPPEVAEVTQLHIQQAFETQTIQIYEYPLDVPGVGLLDYEARMVLSSENEVLVIIRDITQRKQAETALRQSEARQRALLEAIPDLILRISRDGTYLDCKPARDFDTIVPASEIIGKKVYDLLPFELAQQRMQYVEQTLQTRTVQTVEYQLGNDQQMRYQEARFVISGDDEVLLIVRDFTARKLADEALRQTRDELAARVDELETLNFVIRTITTSPDLETALTIVPQTMVQLFKGQRSGVALLNKTGKELKVVAEYRRDENEPSAVGEIIPIDPELYTGQTFQNGQGVVISQAVVDPLTAPVHEMLQRIKTEQLMIVPLLVKGQVIGTIGVDRAQNDPEFTAAEMKLAETIAGQIAGAIEITRLLNEEQQLRQSAEVASEFKSQLLARVSHELRTPLGSILGYSELLQEGIFGPVTADQKQAATEIMESTHYLTSLVNELLDQAQYERGNLELHLTPVSLKKLVSQVQSRMGIFARRKQLDLSFELDPDLPLILLADQKRLQQILINLVNNAIKFTKVGQVTVRLFKSSPTHWTMEVADTGFGISPEAQNFIFEPFRQADGSITRIHGGTGLGLAIVKQFANMMGGHVILESEVGKGSTFRVVLPLHLVQEHIYDESSSSLNH